MLFSHRNRKQNVFRRDYEGTIAIEIDPRDNSPSLIDGITLNSPKKIHGFSIDIGHFHVDKDQTDEEFLNAIHAIDPIVYTITHEPMGLNEEKEDLIGLEGQTQNRSTFLKHQKIVCANLNVRGEEPIKIGGKIIKSPKRFKYTGHKIQIGDFVLDKSQKDEEFLSVINTYNPVAYKAKQKVLDENI